MAVSPDFFEKLIENKMKDSFNHLILDDTGETLSGLKQFRLVTDWYKKMKEVKGADNSATDSFSPKEIINMVKKQISDQLTKGTSGQVSQNIMERLISEVKLRLGKGLDIPPIPLPPVKPSIMFTVYVDGLPITHNALKLLFELDCILVVKGVTAQLESAERLFSTNSIAIELKLFVLTPMMIGVKRTKIGEYKFDILDNLKFPL
jgi:hypothetical protein